MGQSAVDGAGPWTHVARRRVVSDREGLGENEGYMKRRNFVAAMGTAGIGGSAIVGSGAFSRVESKRQVKIETVGDDEAYLRLVYNDGIEFDCAEEVTLLWVTNQLKSDITDVTFDVVGNENVTVTDVQVPDSLEVGEKGEIVANLQCDEDGQHPVNFDIEVQGEDLEVTAHRTDVITIYCECPDCVDCLDRDGEETRLSWIQLENEGEEKFIEVQEIKPPGKGGPGDKFFSETVGEGETFLLNLEEEMKERGNPDIAFHVDEERIDIYHADGENEGKYFHYSCSSPVVTGKPLHENPDEPGNDLVVVAAKDEDDNLIC